MSLALVLWPRASLGSDKQLDAFRSTASLSVSFTPPASGSAATASVDDMAGNAVEGGESVRFDYTFNALSGGALEGFVNPYKTVDLSFAPESLSIWVKAQAGSVDKLRIALYEDQDMDTNPREAGDEVFVSSPRALAAAWTQVVIPFGEFTLSSGGGDGILNLDRIGAWAIVIDNGDGGAHGGQVWVDDLRQVTSYVPPATGTDVLSGAVFQLWNSGAGCECGQWDLARWQAELRKLRDSCQNTIIVQYGIWEGNAWYAPSSLGFVTQTNPTLANIFAAAESLGLHVVVGLYFSEDWNTSNKANPNIYSTLLARDQGAIDELWALFGASPAFQGWYIPQEVEDLHWPNGSPQQVLLASWLRDVSAYAKSKDPSKLVYIAPYFGPVRPADDLEAWYDTVLSTATDIDVVLAQDGVGTTRVDGDVDVPHYMQAIKDACVAHGVAFGMVIESFQQIGGWPVDDGPFATTAADIARLKSQLWIAGQLTSTLVQFEWSFMQPDRCGAAAQLYNDYITYQESVASCGAGPLPTLTPLPAATCVATPLAGCRDAGTTKIRLADKSPDRRDKLVWKWASGPPATLAELGDPLAGTTAYALCVYDETAGVASLAAQFRVPPGGTCGSSGWRVLGTTGYRFKDRFGLPDGVVKLQLKASDGSKPPQIKMSVKGVHAPLPGPQMSGTEYFDQDAHVTVQLQRSDGGACFESVFDAPATSSNSAALFRAGY